MFNTSTRVVAVGVAVLFMAATVRGNDFLDDFEDGDARDGQPVSWQSGGCCPGNFLVSAGDLVVFDNVRDDVVTGLLTDRVCEGDITVSTQVRFDGNVGITAHIGAGTTFYWGVLRASGELLLRRSDDPDFTFTILGTVLLPEPDRRIDYTLQLEFRGDAVEFTAWPSDEPMPAPQISVVDPTYRSGTTGLTFFATDGNAQARFRHYSVSTPIPVPALSGWGLLAMIVVLVAMGRVVLSRRQKPAPMTAR